MWNVVLLKVVRECVLGVRALNCRPGECEVLLLECDGLERELRGTFQWEDSALVRAVQTGGWLVLDSANMASPSVLDRLNCLLEEVGLFQLINWVLFSVYKLNLHIKISISIN